MTEKSNDMIFIPELETFLSDFAMSSFNSFFYRFDP